MITARMVRVNMMRMVRSMTRRMRMRMILRHPPHFLSPPPAKRDLLFSKYVGFSSPDG